MALKSGDYGKFGGDKVFQYISSYFWDIVTLGQSVGLEVTQSYSVPGWMGDGAAFGAEHLEIAMGDDLPPAKRCELGLVAAHCTKPRLSAASAGAGGVSSWCWWHSPGHFVAGTGIKRKSKPRAKNPQRQLVFNKDSALFIPKANAHQVK